MSTVDHTVRSSAAGTPGSPHAQIARQGIYDRERRLVGHELLFRGGDGDTAVLEEALNPTGLARRGATAAGDLATSQVIATTFGDFGVQQLGDGKPLFLNLTRAFLVGDLPLPFGPTGVVLEVLEDVEVDAEVLHGLRALRERGFRLALDDFVGEESRRALLPLVDVVKVELSGPLTEPGVLPGFVESWREQAPGAAFLAERVEDEVLFEASLAAGFELFQGYHLHRPATVRRPRLSPSQIGCLQLLRVLADPSSTTKDIERAVAADPGLSLRVLGTANSAGGSAASHSITSLRQAVVLLGPTALCAWVMLTLLGGASEAVGAGIVDVLARAQCCQLLATRRGLPRGEAYTVGLLSGIAGLLGVDVRSVAEAAGVSTALVQVLERRDGPLGALLDLVVAHEHGQLLPGGIADSYDVSRAYLEAWAASLALTRSALGA
ncbi:EAL and HDOD domain-containing protein [Angustibacter aerolatus]